MSDGFIGSHVHYCFLHVWLQGTVVEWTAQVGQAVEVDDVIAMVETDKVRLSGLLMMLCVSSSSPLSAFRSLLTLFSILPPHQPPGHS